MLFNGQNLKHVHMTYSFLELLIFFWFTLLDNQSEVCFSPHQKEIFYVNTNSKGNQLRNPNKEIYIFTSLYNWFWENEDLQFPINKF